MPDNYLLKYNRIKKWANSLVENYDVKYDTLKQYLNYLKTLNSNPEFDMMIDNINGIDDIIKYYGYGIGTFAKCDLGEARRESDYDAHNALASNSQPKQTTPTKKPTYKVVNQHGQTVKGGFNNEKDALNHWQSMPNNKGHKIIKEDDDILPQHSEFFKKAAKIMIKNHLVRTGKFKHLNVHKDLKVDKLLDGELVDGIANKLKVKVGQ